MWHESKTTPIDYAAAEARGAQDIRYTDTSTHGIDIFGRQYDKSVPVFLQTGTGLVFDRLHRDGVGGPDIGGPYIHVDELNALAVTLGHTWGESERGEAPAWFVNANPQAGYLGFAPGYGTGDPVFDHKILNEVGSGTITDMPGLRVNIDGGGWQTLTEASLTISRTALDELTVAGFSGSETTIDFHYEQQQGAAGVADEPYKAPNTADCMYVAHATGVVPVNPDMPGIALSPTIDGTPIGAV